MNLRPLLIGLGTALFFGLGVLLNAVRRRLRLGRPRWARFWDGAADRLVGALVILVVLSIAVAIVAPGPSSATGGVRLVAGGAAIGLLTGVPFAADRRDARRRLRSAPPPPEPLPLPEVDGEREGESRARSRVRDDPAGALEELGELDPASARAADLRVRAVAWALLGDVRLSRACALRCLQLDHGSVPDVAATGLLLARSGHFRDGVRLLERAVSAAPDADGPRLALVEALRLAGRLREAAGVLDGARPGSG